MIRATLDTNTWASGALGRPETIGEILRRWRQGRFETVVSDHILEELERTLRKPYFAKRINEQDRELFLALLRELATVVSITEPIPDILPDQADNVILATASSAGVPYLISGDRQVLTLGEYQLVRVLSAREFLAILEAEENEES